MELKNEEKAHVFKLYINQQICHSSIETAKLIGIVDTSAHFIHDGTGSYGQCDVMDAGKLLLTPLSGITDEHAIEVGKELYPLLRNAQAMDMFKKTIFSKNHLTYTIYQYLISNGYDVPLWFGIWHPCNGLTPIQLGIAINKNSTL